MTTPSTPDLPVLDRIPYFDERSRDYPIRALFVPEPVKRIRRIWIARATPLDQGREGACVGFAFASELAASPWRHIVNDAAAFKLYQRAQVIDRAMGNNWPAGASILAGAKACLADNTIKSYRWAFGIDEVIETIIRRGPVVLGINWYSDMYSTDENGLVKVSGNKVGGHGIMVNGFWPNHPIFGEDVAVWTNTWGANYGVRGRGFIKIVDLDRLLKEDGEACIPVDARPAQI